MQATIRHLISALQPLVLSLLLFATGGCHNAHPLPEDVVLQEADQQEKPATTPPVDERRPTNAPPTPLSVINPNEAHVALSSMNPSPTPSPTPPPSPRGWPTLRVLPQRWPSRRPQEPQTPPPGASGDFFFGNAPLPSALRRVASHGDMRKAEEGAEAGRSTIRESLYKLYHKRPGRGSLPRPRSRPKPPPIDTTRPHSRNSNESDLVTNPRLSPTSSQGDGPVTSAPSESEAAESTSSQGRVDRAKNVIKRTFSGLKQRVGEVLSPRPRRGEGVPNTPPPA